MEHSHVRKELPFDPGCNLFILLLFPLSVALQKHFKILEALALERDAPEDIDDLTGEW